MFQLGFQGYKLLIPNPVEYRQKEFQEYQKNKEMLALQGSHKNDDDYSFLYQGEVFGNNMLSQYINYFGTKKKGKKKKKKKGKKKKKKSSVMGEDNPFLF